MFLTFPVHVTESIRGLALLLSTSLLVITLITIELIYAEKPRSQRLHLRYFYPLLVVLIGLLIYAATLEVIKK